MFWSYTAQDLVEKQKALLILFSTSRQKKKKKTFWLDSTLWPEHLRDTKACANNTNSTRKCSICVWTYLSCLFYISNGSPDFSGLFLSLLFKAYTLHQDLHLTTVFIYIYSKFPLPKNANCDCRWTQLNEVFLPAMLSIIVFAHWPVSTASNTRDFCCPACSGRQVHWQLSQQVRDKLPPETWRWTHQRESFP